MNMNGSNFYMEATNFNTGVIHVQIRVIHI